MGRFSGVCFGDDGITAFAVIESRFVEFVHVRQKIETRRVRRRQIPPADDAGGGRAVRACPPENPVDRSPGEPVAIPGGIDAAYMVDGFFRVFRRNFVPVCALVSGAADPHFRIVQAVRITGCDGVQKFYIFRVGDFRFGDAVRIGDRTARIAFFRGERYDFSRISKVADGDEIPGGGGKGGQQSKIQQFFHGNHLTTEPLLYCFPRRDIPTRHNEFPEIPGS